MDILNAMVSFIRVAETGSFSVVSRELHVSQPTISRQILMLEKHYGVRLFSRTTRSLTLTDDGRTLLEHARSINSILENSHFAFSRRQSCVSGHVRLGAPTAFGLYLTQKFDGFLKQYPELSIELIVADTFGNIVKDGIDLAIQVGMCQSGTTITRHLVDVERVLVASPEFLRRYDAPCHPNDLLGLPTVMYHYGEQDVDWMFRMGNQEVSVSVQNSFMTNNSEIAHRAIVSSIGVGVVPLFLVQEELEAGRLVRLLPDWGMTKLDLHIVYPGPQNACLRRKAVMDFLVSLAPELRAGVSGGMMSSERMASHEVGFMNVH